MTSINVPNPALPRTAPQAAAIDSAVPYRIPVYVGCTVLVLITNYYLGKDMAWDTLNYQLYAGFSAVNDRFSQDYFPAGPQSYFNPFAYVPFYGLVKSGLPSLAISSILAFAHSIILWLTYELAVPLCPSENHRQRLMFGICAVALAFVNPILMQQMGSSFADITTAELVLAAWVLLAGDIRKPGTARVVYASLLLGAATALKLTNAVHAIAGFAVLIMLPLTLRGRIRQILIYGISLGLGFVIVAAPWSYRLERMFGNPLFPLMNNVFRSPEFTTETLRHFRFIPGTFAEALWRPFAMINPTAMVHEELRAPDPRYALLLVLTIVFLLRWSWRRVTRAAKLSAREEFTVPERTLAALSCGFAADWVMWLSGSGNSRYFLPMASVAAVLVVALVFRLFAAQPKIRTYIFVAVFATQAVQLWVGAAFRWNPTAWDGPWFKIDVPAKLSTERSLYLTLGVQSNAFIAMFLPPDSGLVNFSGGYALTAEGANGARVEALIRRYAPNLRVLMQGARLYGDEERRAPRRSQVDDALARYGLRVDMSDCVTITVHGLHPDPEIRIESSTSVEPQSHDATYLVSCHVVPDNADHSAQIARRRAADLVLDRLEDACPDLFQPRRMTSEHDGDIWRRLYLNTDLMAWVSHGWVKFRNPIGGDPPTLLGREGDWAKAPLQLTCGRRNGRYFAEVLNSAKGP